MNRKPSSTGDTLPRWKSFNIVRTNIPIPKSLRTVLARLALAHKTSIPQLVVDALMRTFIADEHLPFRSVERMAWAEQLLRSCDHLGLCIGYPCSCGLNASINAIDGMLNKPHHDRASREQFLKKNDHGKKPTGTPASDIDRLPEAELPGLAAIPAAQSAVEGGSRASDLRGSDESDRLGGVDGDQVPLESTGIELIDPVEPIALESNARCWEIEWPRLKADLSSVVNWSQFITMLNGAAPPRSFVDWSHKVQLEWLNKNAPL